MSKIAGGAPEGESLDGAALGIGGTPGGSTACGRGGAAGGDAEIGGVTSWVAQAVISRTRAGAAMFDNSRLGRRTV